MLRVHVFQASKVRGHENETGQIAQEDTEKSAKTDIPSVPKTPDAMDHMPEQMKNEYRRLKERLAHREKTKQQDKGGFTVQLKDKWSKTQLKHAYPKHVKNLQMCVNA